MNNREGLYFITFSVVEWIDVFTRIRYSDIVVEFTILSERKRVVDIWMVHNV